MRLTRHGSPSGTAAIGQGDIARLVLAAGCWGLGTVISKAALAEMPPATLLATQLGISLLVLVALMRASGVPVRGAVHPLLARLGLLNPGIAYALSLLGLTSITASISVLLWALEPLLILALAGLVLRERVTPLTVLFSIGAVVGITLVVLDPLHVEAGLIGIGLTAAGIACCAIYSVLTRRWIPGAKDTSHVVLAQQAYGLLAALALVAAVAVLGGQVVPSSVSAVGIASAIASGALYYAGAYWLYLGALRRVPASVAAVSFYLIPIVGVTAGSLLLGERLAPIQWVGAVVVLASVLGIWARSSSADESRISVPA
jgi:drug/metabolite transporter (DMT)-like permease